MPLRFDGTEVRIAGDGRVWVLVAAGVEGPSARWRPAKPESLRIDADWPEELVSSYGRHGVADLHLRAVELSHIMGMPRRDAAKAHAMHSQRRFVRGDSLAMDVEGREIAVIGGSALSEMVFPFTAFAAISTLRAGQLVLRLHWARLPARLPIGEFPMTAEQLAAAVGVVLA